MIVVEADVETGEIALMLLRRPPRSSPPGDPHLLRLEHDGGTVEVVGNRTEMHLMTAHSLITNEISAWMCSSMWPKWNGAVGIGRAQVTSILRGSVAIIRSLCACWDDTVPSMLPEWGGLPRVVAAGLAEPAASLERQANH